MEIVDTELRQGYESLDAVPHVQNRATVEEPGDLPRDLHPGSVLIRQLRPGIDLDLLETERDAALILVDGTLPGWYAGISPLTSLVDGDALVIVTKADLGITDAALNQGYLQLSHRRPPPWVHCPPQP